MVGCDFFSDTESDKYDSVALDAVLGGAGEGGFAGVFPGSEEAVIFAKGGAGGVVPGAVASPSPGPWRDSSCGAELTCVAFGFVVALIRSATAAGSKVRANAASARRSARL